MIIAIDFDGTCVTHEFPKVGKEIGAPEVLKKLVENGHQLVLWTMRSDRGSGTVDKNITDEDPGIYPKYSNYLTQAVEWFKKHGIPLYGIQSNPTQREWTDSPKAYAHLYIDDSALGIPLKYESGESRPYVDWEKVKHLLVNMGYIKN